MSNEAIKSIARRIASAYLAYKNHPCMANRVALASSLETLINETEESENHFDSISSTNFENFSAL